MIDGSGAPAITSALLPFLKHSYFQHIIEWAALTTLGMLITTAISYFFLSIVQYWIGRSRLASDAVSRSRRMIPLFKSILSRHQDLNGKLAAINGVLHLRTRGYERANRVLAQLERRKYVQVRFANAPNRDMLKFSGYVYNEFVKKYVSKGQHYPLLDDDWAVPQLIEVWAENAERAELEISRKYPKMFGFIVTNLEKVKPPPTREELAALAGEGP